MKKFVMEKKIVIKDNRRIKLKGNVMGPIEIPYIENTETIAKLIMQGYKVYEVFSDNTEERLTLANFNIDIHPEKTSLRKKAVTIKHPKEVLSNKPKKQKSPRIVFTGTIHDELESL